VTYTSESAPCEDLTPDLPTIANSRKGPHERMPVAHTMLRELDANFGRPAAERRPWWTDLRATLGSTAGQGGLALFDQFVVSGASFLTTVLIGRNCTENELALYALASSVVILGTSLQLAIISVPYSIHGTRLPDEDRPGYAGSTLAHQLMLSGLLATGMGVAAFAIAWTGGTVISAATAATLAAVIVPVLLKEYIRRVEMAHLRVAAACRLDAAVATLQIGGLLFLVYQALLSARTAFAMIGVACGLAAARALWSRRAGYALRLANVGNDFRRSWALGKWVLAAQAINAVVGSIVPWLLVLLRPTTAETAVFSACQGVALLANPFLLGMSGFVGPKAAHAFTAGGMHELRLVVSRMAWFISAVAAMFVVVMLAFGEQLVVALYGSQYAGRGATVCMLAASVFVYAISLAPDLGLWAMERAELNVRPRLFGLAVTLVAGLVLVPSFGVLGGACSFLAGNAVASVGIIVIYRNVVVSHDRSHA